MDIPAKIRKAPNDHVKYIVVGNKNGNTVDNICYSSHMGALATTEFRLVPHPDSLGYAIDGESFCQWIDLLKAYSIVPRQAKASIDSGENCLHIPRGGLTRHGVYAALCAYRCAESYAPMVYAVLKLCEERPELSFWQIYHYAASQHGPQPGHHWSYTAPTVQTSIAYNHGGAVNLGMLVAAIFFWHQRKMQQQPAYTCDAIRNLAHTFAPCKVHKGFTYPTMCWNAILQGKEIDILDESWTPFLKFIEDAAVQKVPPASIGEEIRKRYEQCPHAKKDQELTESLIKKMKNGYYGGW